MAAPNDPTVIPQNYEEQGGTRWVIRGTLSMSGGKITGADGTTPTIANLTGAPTQSDFNGLLAALRNAGIIQ